MRRYITVAASFVIMLCLGGMFAWSLIAKELTEVYGFSAARTQLVFGIFFTVFPVAMLFAGKAEKRLGPRNMTIISSLFFTAGYLLSSFSNGNYLLILTGMGVMAGIGTGFGYLAALTLPVRWFPDKKGLITGVVVAGFGFAAIFYSLFAEYLLNSGREILEVFKIIGITYGAVIVAMAFLLINPAGFTESISQIKVRFANTSKFYKLFFGLFLGTFAGLLIIGNLTPMGAEHGISSHILVLGVSGFAVANSAGRVSWGFISDYIGAGLTILFALAFQGVSILLIGYPNIIGQSTLTPTLYLVLSAMIGFGFGGNFVLFAKETAQFFGIPNMGAIYPYVFLGYSFAGLLGPLTGGVLFDIFKSYDLPILISAVMSIAGAGIFLTDYFRR
jgi:OFA family oxalate/formate antiporter-like MFS transporter